MGLSKDLPKLSEYVQSKAVQLTPRDIIQSPFTFEFLGLKAPDVLSEHDLEKALLDNLQDFMLELGNGFCLEARQKRLLIGDEHYFVDMVFYHRLLRCHILIELKIDEFKHEYIGQLNSYLGYYKAEVMPSEDNPPIGILLVTNQNKTLVEYATAGLDDRLFVQKYLTELPSKEKLEQFIQSHL
jgi:predicted nuclease of restriction endonuclease-like (RecB) superfamily